jgi:hypothetical protein
MEALLQQFRTILALQQANTRMIPVDLNPDFNDDDLCFMVNVLLSSCTFKTVQKNYKYYQILNSHECQSQLVHLSVELYYFSRYRLLQV